jgi:hypothetical protein
MFIWSLVMVGALLLCAIVSVGLAVEYYQNKMREIPANESHTEIVLKSAGIGFGLILLGYIILIALIW